MTRSAQPGRSARGSRFCAALVALALGGPALSGCQSGPVRPAELDTKNEQCATCRMAVSDARFAGQLVAPGEEPRFFDDLGCLRNYVRQSTRIPQGAAVFVADHRTRAWLPGADAVYTRQDALETPMGSHLIAHRDAASREADPDARGGVALSAQDVFGPQGPPRGAP